MRRLRPGGLGGIHRPDRLMIGARPLLVALVMTLSIAVGGCKRHYAVGDHVLVEWEGNVYPAMILEAVSPTKYKIHYDDYDPIWDEVVQRDRIRGIVEGNVIHPEPPAKVRTKALQAAQTNVYKIGDRVRVEWHGQMYPAVITGIVGSERYRIHYEGYGAEWDETVGLSRIQVK
jgi:hypothetical protein